MLKNFVESVLSLDRSLVWDRNYDEGVSWRGVRFTANEWEQGTLLAASKIHGRNSWVPDACVLWELVRTRHLPFYYPVLVPTLRQLAALGVICTFQHDAAGEVPLPSFLRQPASEQIQ